VNEPRCLVSGIHRCLRAGAAVGLAIALAGAGCGGSSSPAAPTAAPTAVPPSPRFVEASFREAARVTAAAQVAVLQAARPGLYERDIKAVIDAAYGREGGGPPAFAHITASGPNALQLHYAGDARQLVDGDLLLVDIGATSNQHCADVTRTYPVSGRFTERQRAIYQLVLDAQALALARARVGADSLASIGTAVRDFFRSSPLRAKNAAGVESTMDAFFIHSLSHYVGRDVHGADTGWDPGQPIQPDQVFVFEPGLYIASEGIGIRLEDTFLATRAGLECLSCASPKGTSEIERRP
jgi:Xaa-Pro aminopeptidase